MKLFGMELNRTMVLWFGLHALIIVDILLITAAMIFTLPVEVAIGIMIFDFFVCLLLLGEWTYNFYLSSPKSVFLKQKENWISLIASIPFDVILPAIVPGIGILRYLRLLKLLRVIVLFSRFVEGFQKFLHKSNLDKILGGVFITVIIFTVLLWLFGSSYSLFDDFYFVIVTLTTVGYGDVVPRTHNEKVISVLLIVVGVFVFSTITAAISSYLTDKLIDDEGMGESLEIIKEDMVKLHEENEDLKREIQELKELIREK